MSIQAVSRRFAMGLALWTVAMVAAPARGGPIIDWFKSLHAPPKPPCATCPKPVPGTYYPGAAAPGAVVAPNVVPGPVTYGPLQPGVMQPGVMQPGVMQPGVAAPSGLPPAGTTFPGTVTPGSAFPPRTTNYAPAVSQAMYYPPAAGGTPVGGIPVGGAPVVGQVAYYAPSATCPTCPTCPQAAPSGIQRPTVVQYAPYTAYRTSWVQVPVTVYRPITALDPATGRPVTVVQPCTATTWQVQRIPVGGRPFLSMYQPLPVSGYGVAPAAIPSAAPANCPGGVCPTAAPAVGTGVAIPGSTFPNTTLPGTTLPGTTLAPSSVMPSVPAAPPATAPSAAAPPTTFGPPARLSPGGSTPTTQPSYLGDPARVAPGAGGSAPADRRPTLGPGEGSSLNYPPETDLYRSPPPYSPPPYSPPYSPPYTPPSAPTTNLGTPSQGSSTSQGSSGGAMPLSAPPSDGGREASVESSSNPGPASGRGAPSVTPLPDPDAAPYGSPSPPRLIVPRERTAASRGTQPTHRVVPAVSADPVRRTETGTRAETRTRAEVDRSRTWDDSGWKSARP